jgi:hypothetical protein
MTSKFLVIGSFAALVLAAGVSTSVACSPGETECRGGKTWTCTSGRDWRIIADHCKVDDQSAGPFAQARPRNMTPVDLKAVAAALTRG